MTEHLCPLGIFGGAIDVPFESCSLSSELTLERDYLVRVELWPKGCLSLALLG